MSEQKKKTYAKSVRESNQHRLEEQKRTGHNGQQKNRPIPVPKHQRVGNNHLSLSLTNHHSELTNLNVFTYCLWVYYSIAIVVYF